MMQVGRALQNHVEAVACVRANGSVRSRPVLGRLLANGLEHDFNRIVEFLQSVSLGRRCRFRKLAWPVTHIPRLRDLRADVVIQIASEMQNQVPKAVAKSKWLAPELRITERRSQLADSGGQ